VIAMIEQRDIILAGPRSGSPLFAALATLLWLAAAMVIHDDHAVAQLNVQPPQAQPAPAQPQPAAAAPQAQPAQPAQPAQAGQPPKKESFLDALGRWWDQSAADFDANLKKMKSSIEEANERNAKAAREAVNATKEATDALSKFPTTRIIEGRERCVLAPNGSPDCGPAAEKICTAKGFKSGQSANIESARKCSARAILTRNEQDCVNETIVTRAACQ
jgi:hypothetical protein